MLPEPSIKKAMSFDLTLCPEGERNQKHMFAGTSQVVQWLRILPANAGDMSFDSRSGKIPHAWANLSCAITATKPMHPRPRLCNKKKTTAVTSPHTTTERSSCRLQLERARARSKLAAARESSHSKQRPSLVKSKEIHVGPSHFLGPRVKLPTELGSQLWHRDQSPHYPQRRSKFAFLSPFL